MKQSRVLVCAALVAWSVSAAAFADPVTLYSTGNEAMAAIGVNRTYDAAWELDKVVLTLDSWLSPSFEGAKVNVIVGTWSVSGPAGAGIYLSTPDWDWSEETAGYEFKGTYYVPDPPQSYVNFDSIVTNAAWSREPVSGDLYASFYGGWYASTPTYWRGIGDELATFFVTPDAQLTFMAADNGVDGFVTNLGAIYGSFTTIPEPGALALLAGGLLGMLAYAWRRRK